MRFENNIHPRKLVIYAIQTELCQRSYDSELFIEILFVERFNNGWTGA